MTNLRWKNYAFNRNDKFHAFWDEYLSLKERDLLFITGLGFDIRMCNAINSIIEKGGDGKRDCIVFRFEEGKDSPSNQYIKYIEENEKHIEELFTDNGSIETKTIEMITETGRRIGSHNASSIISDMSELEGYSDIIIDISSTPRGLFFPLIGKILFLNDQKKKGNDVINIHIIVSENPQIDSLIETRGLDDKANFIYGFSKNINLESAADIPTIWMPMLGENKIEHMRRIHTLVSPIEEICPILPFPANNPRRGDDLIIEYREILFDQLRVDPSNIIYVAENNPFEVYRQILRSVSQYQSALEPLGGCKIILSVLSSKLLSLGALLAAYDLKQNNCSIGIAHIEAQGHIIKNEEELTRTSRKVDLYSLWLTGECYYE